jgi:hypothetical protein
MDLTIHYETNFDVTLRSRDYSIMIALYEILNDTEDKATRILFCFYLGYSNELDIVNLIHVSNSEYKEHCKSLALRGFIERYSKELSNAGLDFIHRKIRSDISVLFDCSCFDYTPENFKKIEITKKECAKKKVLNVLQRRDGNQKIAEDLSYV